MQRLEEVIAGRFGDCGVWVGWVVAMSCTRANAWPGSVVLLGSADAAGRWTLSSDGHLTHEL